MSPGWPVGWPAAVLLCTLHGPCCPPQPPTAPPPPTRRVTPEQRANGSARRPGASLPGDRPARLSGRSATLRAGNHRRTSDISPPRPPAELLPPSERPAPFIAVHGNHLRPGELPAPNGSSRGIEPISRIGANEAASRLQEETIHQSDCDHITDLLELNRDCRWYGVR